ncbi:MAG: YtxH domain-containing protein [Pyrinomonadaceae bacterium]
MTSLSTQKHSNGSSNVATNLTYLLIGGGIGATLALLFAPKAGSELRHDISEITHKGLEGTRDLAHQLKSQTGDLYSALKEKKDEVYDFASEKLARAENAVETAAKTAGETAEKTLNKAADAVDGKDRSRSGATSSF